MKPFRVRVEDHQGNLSDAAAVTVFDGWDVVKAEGEGSVSTDLPPGLYTVRVERAGSTSERVIRHETGTDETLAEPLRVSAVPSFDTATTHEYYAYTSHEWSGQDTRAPIGAGGNGRLFVFIRALSKEDYAGEDLAAGLSLLDEAGSEISGFAEDETERNDAGWLAFSAVAEPGAYALTHSGDVRRKMPLYVYPGLSTQVFLAFQGGLRFDSVSILMPRANEQFNPDDRMTQAIDAAMTGLQQRRDYLPRDAMQMLLYGKFDNPMLGVLGAHVLLMREKPSEGTLDTVLGNLDYLLPESPDVQALRLMTADRFGRDPSLEPFIRPPMIRAGLEAVLRLSVDHPELVPEDGLLESISTRVHVDSPWTSWSPDVVQQVVGSRGVVSVGGTIMYPASGVTVETTRGPAPADEEWVAEMLRDAKAASQRTGDGSLDLKRLAAQAGVPVRVLERVQRALPLKPDYFIPSADDVYIPRPEDLLEET